MSGFDILVMVLVGFGAARGFLKGFVREVITLAAWGVALVCIHTLHSPLAEFLQPHLHSESGASVLAFLLLVAIPVGGTRLLGNYLGDAARHSVLGPVDRVLGFGFGAVRGALIVVLAFSVLVLVYDTIWGVSGRPTWLTHSRSYSFVDASSKALVKAIARRHAAADAEGGADAASSAASDAASAESTDDKPKAKSGGHRARKPAAD